MMQMCLCGLRFTSANRTMAFGDTVLLVTDAGLAVWFKCWAAGGSRIHIPARRTWKVLGCQKAEGEWVCAGFLLYLLGCLCVSVCASFCLYGREMVFMSV